VLKVLLKLQGILIRFGWLLLSSVYRDFFPVDSAVMLISSAGRKQEIGAAQQQREE
jgi:hypothetical protein